MNYLYLTLFLGIIILIIYFVLFSPYFKITQETISYFDLTRNQPHRISDEPTEVEDNSYVEIDEAIKDQLSKRKALIFSQKSIFFFDEEGITEKIKNDLVLETFTINKKLPNKLAIFYEKKVPMVIWTTNNKYSYLDKRGLSIKEELFNFPVPDPEPIESSFAEASEDKAEEEENTEEALAEEATESSNEEETPEEPIIEEVKINYTELILNRLKDEMFPIIYNAANQDVELRENIPNPEIIDYVNDILSFFSKNKDIKITYFYLQSEVSTEIKAFTSEGWFIYFDTKKPLESQIQKLYITLNEKIKKNRIYLEYIDLRFPERVYYK